MQTQNTEEFFMKPYHFLLKSIFLMLLSLSYYSQAQKNYLNLQCNEAEKLADERIERYKSSKNSRYWKALDRKMSCLFLRGNKKASAFSEQRLAHDKALSLMEESIQRGSIYALLIKAFYIRTNGTFEDFKKTNQSFVESVAPSIQAYKRVLKQIDNINGYPFVKDSIQDAIFGNYEENIYVEDEEFFQPLLSSIERLLYYQFKALSFSIYDHHWLLLKASFINQKTKEFGDFNRFLLFRELDPSHYQSNSLPALENLKKTLSRCLKTSYQNYWYAEAYNFVQNKCQILHQYLPTLEHLEKARLELEFKIYENIELLNKGQASQPNSCIDALDCPQYEVLAEKVSDLILKIIKEASL